MSKLSRFIKTAFIYFFGNILSKIISFVLLPLYTSRLNPSQYGDYDLTIALLNVIYPIVFFQIWDSMFRFTFDYDEIEEKYRVISNSICVFAIGSIIYFSTMICSSLVYHINYFLPVLFLGFIEAIRYLYSFAARAFLMNKLFVVSGAINTFVNASLNVLLIVCFGWGIEALYVAPIIGCLVQIIIIEFSVKLINHFHMQSFSINMIREMLKFSIPLCIATVSYWLLSGLTKVIITRYLGSYSNGLYAVANRFASMITLFVSVFQYAWNESAYLLNSDNNRVGIFEKCINIFLNLILYGTGCIICFIKVIFPFFIAENYSEAISIIPTCLLGVAFNSMAGFLSTLYMTEKQTRFVLTSTLIAACINIVLCIPFTNTLELQGAILALDISFLILMGLRIFRLKKIMSIKFNTNLLLCLFMLMISVIAYYKGDLVAIVLCMMLNFTLALYSTRDITIPLIQKVKIGR